MTTTAKRLMFLLLPCFLSACSPKIVTIIHKSYPEIAGPDQIYLFEIGDSVPVSYDVIGNISISDNGLSTGCNYDQIINLAKNETSKAGGNALALTKHLKPDFISSCHRINGLMLILNQMPEEGNIDIPETPIENNTSFDVPVRKFKHNTLYANFGYSYIYSRFYLPSEATGNPKNGFDWQIGYDVVSRKGLGFGVLCAGYKSKYSLNDYSYVFTEPVKLDLIYLAPQFVLQQEYGKWIMKEYMGIGFFGYREISGEMSYNMKGLGYNLSLNIEYLITKTLGAGINFGYLGSRFSEKQDNLDYADNEYAGITRLFIDAGIRLHF